MGMDSWLFIDTVLTTEVVYGAQCPEDVWGECTLGSTHSLNVNANFMLQPH
jgi:hypothetical protein